MARASIKSYNKPHSRPKGRGKGWHEKAVYVQDAGKRVAPRHREVALRGHHSKPRSTSISSHYSRQLMNRGNIQRTIPKAPKKSYDTGHTIHNVDMVELKQNDVNVFVDGEGNIISYSYQHDGATIKIPEVGPVKQRNEIYTKRSIKHPAKMNTIWAQSMIQNYSKPDDTILDPMGGIGTTAVEGSRLGRNVISIEFEKKWCTQAKKNVELLEQSGQKIGDVDIRQGDARDIRLKKKVDVVMFSPPYGHDGAHSNEFTRKHKLMSEHDVYSKNKDNIGLKKGNKYFEDMEQVYQSCHKVLKSEGTMVVNTKNRVENQKEVRFDLQTQKLIEQAGFKLIEKKRVSAHPNVYRVWYEKKYPDAPKIHHEDFMVFEKVSNI